MKGKFSKRLMAAVLAVATVLTVSGVLLAGTLAQQNSIAWTFPSPTGYGEIDLSDTTKELNTNAIAWTASDLTVATFSYPDSAVKGRIKITPLTLGAVAFFPTSRSGMSLVYNRQIVDNTRIASYTLSNGGEVGFTKRELDSVTKKNVSTVLTTVPALGTLTGDKAVAWMSCHSAVAEVSAAGLITPKALGTATIIGTVKDKYGVLQMIPVVVRIGTPLGVTVGDNGKSYLDTDNPFVFLELDDNGKVSAPPKYVYNEDKNPGNGSDKPAKPGGNQKWYVDNGDNTFYPIDRDTGVLGGDSNLVCGGLDLTPGTGDDRIPVVTGGDGGHYLPEGENYWAPGPDGLLGTLDDTYWWKGDNGVIDGPGKGDDVQLEVPGGGGDEDPEDPPGGGIEDQIDAALVQATTISAGGAHGSAIKANGTLWSWGYLDGVVRSTPEQSASGVSAAFNSTDATSSGEQEFYIKSDGTLWGRGLNSCGQLGDGTTTSVSSSFVQVKNMTNVVSVAAGFHFTIALKSDGTVWAWGYNAHGELGLGTTDNNAHSTPVQVTALGNSVKAIFRGAYVTFAIKKDGTVWAWGRNDFGQLGLGDTAVRSTPTLVPNLSNIKSIESGLYHTMALRADGTVWACGRNHHGQLGDSTMDDRYTFAQVNSLSEVKAIAVSYAAISAVLKSDGTVFTWGLNDKGQLGLGDTTNRLTPALISNLSNVMAVSCGMHYMMALKTDGTLWTWGYNMGRALGNGGPNDQVCLSPIQILTGAWVK